MSGVAVRAYDRQQWPTLLASNAARTYLTNPKIATPIVNSRKSERAILNSRLILMSGHTARARVNSTRSRLLVGMTLAIAITPRIASAHCASVSLAQHGRTLDNDRDVVRPGTRRSARRGKRCRKSLKPERGR